jgi:hypothetical protein
MGGNRAYGVEYHLLAHLLIVSIPERVGNASARRPDGVKAGLREDTDTAGVPAIGQHEEVSTRVHVAEL